MLNKFCTNLNGGQTKAAKPKAKISCIKCFFLNINLAVNSQWQLTLCRHRWNWHCQVVVEDTERKIMVVSKLQNCSLRSYLFADTNVVTFLHCSCLITFPLHTLKCRDLKVNFSQLLCGKVLDAQFRLEKR